MKRTPEELAQQLDELLTGIRVSGSAFVMYFKMGRDADNLQGRIHFQTGALEMLQDVRTYLRVLIKTQRLLRFAVLGIQQRLTEAATRQNEKGA